LPDVEGLWVVLFGTRLEIVRAPDAAAARTIWLERNYPRRGATAPKDPALAGFARPVGNEVLVRSCTEDDVERLLGFDPSFKAKLRKA
jgi:hypothetical protein